MTGEVICHQCKKWKSFDWYFLHFLLNPKHTGQQVNTECSRMMPRRKK